MGAEKIKCVVWDLDNTLWDGVLLEDADVKLKAHTRDVIEHFDRVGILQSVSSKNDFETAKAKLEEFGLWDYFIYPQINWNAKSEAVKEIAKCINIGINTLAFVDDQAFEREEVSFACPDVLCIDSAEMEQIPKMERLIPKYVTTDSKNRRKMYQNDIARNQAEKEFVGTKEAFLAGLQMKFSICSAREEDLQRAEELTVRTHQLNSTGYVYSYDELKQMISDDRFDVLVTRLEDKFGVYGTIGLAVVEKQRPDLWRLNLLLMSCRVMSKGVGNVLMNYIINCARDAGAALEAQFVPTNKNRMMYITYKFNGFHEKETGETVLMEADMSYERKLPDYIDLKIERN